MTGRPPDLAHLRIFGSRIESKCAGKRRHKLDRHAYTGIFLGFGATDKLVKYIDTNSGREKLAKHVIFDEAHYTSDVRPPGPQFLYDIGLPQDPTPLSDTNPPHKQTNEINSPYPPLSNKPNTPLHKRHLLTPLPLAERAVFHPSHADAARLETVWQNDDIFKLYKC